MQRTDIARDWHGKPYYSLDSYCKNTFHHKCYKIALNARMSCPNRDGTLDTRGCIFCSRGGSGDFAVDILGKSMEEQIAEGISNFGNKSIGQDLIAYFQAYTNTYAPLPYLEEVYRSALDHPDICGISIATRPDCLGPEVLALLSRLKEEYHDKFLWVELGLQTIHEETASYIRRGYPLSCFEKACADLKTLQIPIIVHTILGLPGEFEVLTLDAYLDLVISCLAHLSPEIVIHRVTGDGPKDLLIAPKWSLDKRGVLNALHHRMKKQGIRQGDLYQI